MAKLRRRCGTGAVLLCLAISGCGGDDSAPTEADAPTATPAPSPAPRTVVVQDNFQLDVGAVRGRFFDIGGTGTIDALINYTFVDSLVAVWLARGECTFELFSADQCTYVVTPFDIPPPRTPATGGGTSGTIVFATDQPAGTYTLIILNDGPDTEIFAVQVLFIAQASAASRIGGHWLGRHVVHGAE